MWTFKFCPNTHFSLEMLFSQALLKAYFHMTWQFLMWTFLHNNLLSCLGLSVTLWLKSKVCLNMANWVAEYTQEKGVEGWGSSFVIFWCSHWFLWFLTYRLCECELIPSLRLLLVNLFAASHNISKHWPNYIMSKWKTGKIISLFFPNTHTNLLVQGGE